MWFQEDDGCAEIDISIENTGFETQTCYVCNQHTESYFQNLNETKSDHTNTRICDFLTKWLGKNAQIDNLDDDCICVDCLNKVNEYDLLCVAANEIENGLRDTFLLTESF